MIDARSLDMSDVYEVITDDADNPVVWVKAYSKEQVRDAYDGFGTTVISIDKLQSGDRFDDDLTSHEEGGTGSFFNQLLRFISPRFVD